MHLLFMPGHFKPVLIVAKHFNLLDPVVDIGLSPHLERVMAIETGGMLLRQMPELTLQLLLGTASTRSRDMHLW